jgi:hypothetical protein
VDKTSVYFFIELGDKNFFFRDTCLLSASCVSFAVVSSVLDDEHLSNDSENKNGQQHNIES